MKKSAVIFILFISLLLASLTSCISRSPQESSKDYNNDWEDEEMTVTITPAVKEMQLNGKALTVKSVSIRTDETTSEIALTKLENQLKEYGIDITTDANKSLYLGANHEKAGKAEAYYINTEDTEIILSSSTEKGQYYAVLTLDQLFIEDKLFGAVIYDEPAFPIRGVVEGFYGAPWSHENRLSIINFLGDHKMNTYLYAPKDDAKLRDLWREFYSDVEKELLMELLNTANEKFVKFVYSISPGQDFDFGEGYDEDFSILLQKCNSMYELGVRDFALLLDDLPYRTEALAANHVRLVNDFRKAFFADKPELSELITIFAEYLDTIVTEEYTNTITNNLNDNVIVMWTGPTIDIHMKASGFNFANEAYNRQMLLWWNYPVNDYCTDNLLVDGVQGLSRDLHTAIQGLLSNPMNQAETSKVVLYTLSEYLWNPSAYSYKKSYDRAINQLFPQTAESVKFFFENLYGSGINKYNDSELFKRLIKSTNEEQLSQELERLLFRIEDIRNNCQNKVFVDEVNRWLDKAELSVKMGLHYLSFKNEEQDELFFDAFNKYYSLYKSYNENTARFSQNVLSPFILQKTTAVISERVAGIKLPQTITRTSNLKPEVTASLAHYDNYIIQNAIDNDAESFYWSNGAANKGFWIMLDFGSVENVFNIYLKSGASPSGGDYIYSGQMQYSIDGIEWFDIGETQNSKTILISGLDIECRYLRYISLADQEYWLAVSNFEANIRIESDLVDCQPYGIYGNEVYKLIDGDPFTTYIAERPTKIGDSININVEETTFENIIILQNTISTGNLFVDDIFIGELIDYYNYFSLPKDTNPRSIKIIWEENQLPVINEVILK